MPPRTPPAAKSAGTPARGAQAPAAAARKAPAARKPMKTFAEHTGSRPAPVITDAEAKLQTRSFQLPIAVVERLRATSDGLTHVAYGSPLEGEVPDSISGMVVEALNAICTFYEDQNHEGLPFRRVRKLSPGARPTGAARGAAQRSRIAAEKRAKNTEEE